MKTFSLLNHASLFSHDESREARFVAAAVLRNNCGRFLLWRREIALSFSVVYTYVQRRVGMYLEIH